MKIKNLGVTITEIPWLKSIRVESGDEILLDMDDGGELSFTRAEITELRDALTTAITHAQAMRPQPEPQPEPQCSLKVGDVVSSELTEPLPEGTVVKDVDGDEWSLDPYGWVSNYGQEVQPLDAVQLWRPLTIVSLP